MKPKAYKTFTKYKKIRVAKYGSALEAIGKIKKGCDIFVLTFGQFSMIDALSVIVDQTGPATVDISTWSASTPSLIKMIEMINASDITNIRIIIDRSLITRKPTEVKMIFDSFGSENVRQLRTHAKFLIIRNEQWNIVVRTSMNLNENPRLENLEITDSKEFADFFTTITDCIFDEIPEDKSESDHPELKKIDGIELFKEIKADHIKRSSLKEVSFTHEIKNKRGVCQSVSR